ncbi:thiamine kinase-like enzyme [Rhodoligotrophos appendicifer]|uniref:choline/ethanolamine kinase family protein n=1 Tax=Rhodoligotrophos appendicifer TaxID=987056 RepID=UPI00117DB596|nr:phosphotransferase [Rhodoligotrophos appendicifer]
MSPEEILATLPIWKGTPELSALMEGRTNRNFIIRDAGSTYFGRVGIDLPHHNVWRSNERLCATMAADGGVAPRVHYAASGILITDFIQGRTLHLPEMHDAEVIAETARTVQRLHALPVVEGLNSYCGVAVCKHYLAALPDDDLPVPRARILSRLGEPSPLGTCLVHGDIIPENLIRTEGGIMLIDWEYAGLGIPEVDLASIIANCDLTAPEIGNLLEAYGPHRPELLEQQRVALVIREALWCLTQLRHSGPEGDLESYTTLCVNRMLREF